MCTEFISDRLLFLLNIWLLFIALDYFQAQRAQIWGRPEPVALAIHRNSTKCFLLDDITRNILLIWNDEVHP